MAQAPATLPAAAPGMAGMTSGAMPAYEPTEGIEVTPEMAEAGAAELARFTRVFDTLEDGATRIFRAMMGVKKQSEITD